MTNRINVLYTCDNAYLPLTSISMASVISNNPDSDICFYIATESKENKDFDKLVNFYSNNKQITIKHLDCKEYDSLLESKNLDKWGSKSFYVYWKLFAYDKLDVDYIWYLDSDELCLSKIENPDLLDKAIGGTLDSAHASFNKVAHINDNYYFFNTGALFINVNNWKKNNCTEKIVNYIKEMKYKPLMCDQDIFAIALQNDFKVLNPKYNFLAGYDYYGVHNSFKMYSLDSKPFYKEKEIEEAKDKVVFYHYLGGVFGRPWQKGNYCPRREYFIEARKNSCWPEFETEFNQSTLFKVQKVLEILPKGLYNKIHNLAQRLHVKSMAK